MNTAHYEAYTMMHLYLLFLIVITDPYFLS